MRYFFNFPSTEIPNFQVIVGKETCNIELKDSSSLNKCFDRCKKVKLTSFCQEILSYPPADRPSNYQIDQQTDMREVSIIKTQFLDQGFDNWPGSRIIDATWNEKFNTQWRRNNRSRMKLDRSISSNTLYLILRFVSWHMFFYVKFPKTLCLFYLWQESSRLFSFPLPIIFFEKYKRNISFELACFWLFIWVSRLKHTYNDIYISSSFHIIPQN